MSTLTRALLKSRSASHAAEPQLLERPECEALVEVLGEKGSGKSFLCKVLIHQVLAENGQSWVITCGNDYEKLCQYFGGHYLDEAMILLNPFSCVTNIEASLEPLDRTILHYLRPVIRLAFQKRGNHGKETPENDSVVTVDDIYLPITDKPIRLADPTISFTNKRGEIS